MGLNEEYGVQDGVHALVPRERMTESARKLRDTYAVTPGAPFFRREFGYFCLERWHEEGLPRDADLAAFFGYDPPGNISLDQLGWCEAAFEPAFEVKVLEARGDHEIEQDYAGRHVLYFKGRRDGFMPEYVDHPVKDWKTWEENVKWRLDPSTPERYVGIEPRMAEVQAAAAQGLMVVQNLIGGYMYLRSLAGPADLLCLFCEAPDLIHDCMRTWLALADAVAARHQEYVTVDEVFLAEDICFNHGALISPDMMREFLLPYYQELLDKIRARQIDRTRHLYVQIDTDGFSDPVIPLYKGIGMDMMSPFEVAAGCDVVRTAEQYPGLIFAGGIDKRVLAAGKAEIDRHVDRILSVMRARGGYIPTCDHGVPEEVSLDNYLHYRKRFAELAG